ncbi:hypothetical protein EJ110_NYTH35150 [Nymphaea thermarum]|nr:hypothetical protein EJ110_NYTH35150 [Nymphaea thermarum]
MRLASTYRYVSVRSDYGYKPKVLAAPYSYLNVCETVAASASSQICPPLPLLGFLLSPHSSLRDMSSIGPGKGLLEVAKFGIYVAIPIVMMYTFAYDSKNLERIMGNVSSSLTLSFRICVRMWYIHQRVLDLHHQKKYVRSLVRRVYNDPALITGVQFAAFCAEIPPFSPYYPCLEKFALCNCV